MIRIPIDIRGIGVWRDLRANRWTIEDQQHTYTLQEWNWGLRHQLARTAIVAGQLDRELFIDSLFAVLVDPQPATDRIRLAYTVLHLLNVPEQIPAVSLARAEMLLAQSYGWRPDDLREHSVASLDDMVQTLAQQDRQHPTHQRSDGWKSIVFTQPGSSTTETSDHNTSTIGATTAHDQNTDAVIRARLHNMLDAIVFWAGLTVEPELETTEDGFVQEQSQSITGDSSKQAGPKAVNVSAEVGDPHEPPATFFKGTARLKALSSRSTRENDPISKVSHDNPSHVESGNTGLQQNNEMIARNDRLKDLRNRQPEREAIESLVDDSEPEFSIHKRNVFNNPAPAPATGASVQHHNDRLNSAASSQLTANTAWPAAGNKTVRQNIDVNESAHTPTNHNDAWQPLHGNLPSHAQIPPSHTQWKSPGSADTAIDTIRAGHSAGLAAVALPRDTEWPFNQNRQEIVAAANEVTFPSDSESIVMGQRDNTKTNPFALSEFEEQLADTLERAVSEAGSDIP